MLLTVIADGECGKLDGGAAEAYETEACNYCTTLTRHRVNTHLSLLQCVLVGVLLASHAD